MHQFNEGFLLPTVIFVSLAIAMIGTAALGLITSLSVDQNGQYHRSIAQQAAKAGIEMARTCYGNSAWTSPITTGMACDGSAVGVDYVAVNDNWRSSYVASLPVTNAGVTTISVVGTVTFYNKAGIAVGDVVSSTVKAKVAETGSVDALKTMAGGVSRGPMNDSIITSYGNATAYAISSEGRIYAWGSGSDGALGNGTNPSSVSTPVAVDMTVFGTEKAVSLTSVGGSVSRSGDSLLTHYGYSTMYAISDAGKIYAWGIGSSGMLGNGTNPSSVSTPVAVDMTVFGTEKAISLTTVAGGVSRSGDSILTSDGRSTVYAISDAGKIYAWGSGSSGMLGNGTNPSSVSTPVAVTTTMMGGSKVKSVVAVGGDTSRSPMNTTNATSYGDSTAYALTEDGKIYAWGSGSNGMLGNGTNPSSVSTPVAVSMAAFGSEKAVSVVTVAGNVSRTGSSATVSNGRSTVYAVSDAGKIYAWGSGSEGVLGNGTNPSSTSSPVVVDTSMMGGSKVVSVVTLAGNVARAPKNSSTIPSYGNSTAYALTEDGKIYAWGSGSEGVLGNGTNPSSISTPVPVDMTPFGSERVTAIVTMAGSVSRASDSLLTSYGRSTIYAMSDANKVYVWGSGAEGAHGNGANENYVSTPIKVNIGMMSGTGSGSGVAFEFY